MPIEEAKSIKVLSIDGGGIRGIIPAIILDALQQRVGKPPHDTYDLIAGTSTGGIITVGIGTACNQGKPYTPQELVGLYVQNGATIFKTRFLQALRELMAPKYFPDGPEEVLAKYFGEAEFKSALTLLLVSSYDLQSQMPFIFKSHRITAHSNWNWPVRQIARATSAAPTYFLPFHLVARRITPSWMEESSSTIPPWPRTSKRAGSKRNRGFRGYWRPPGSNHLWRRDGLGPDRMGSKDCAGFDG